MYSGHMGVRGQLQPSPSPSTFTWVLGIELTLSDSEASVLLTEPSLQTRHWPYSYTPRKRQK